ncbi:hypothetical protein ABZP36_028781 [Zizania latifolia]
MASVEPSRRQALPQGASDRTLDRSIEPETTGDGSAWCPPPGGPRSPEEEGYLVQMARRGPVTRSWARVRGRGRGGSEFNVFTGGGIIRRWIAIEKLLVKMHNAQKHLTHVNLDICNCGM